MKCEKSQKNQSTYMLSKEWLRKRAIAFLTTALCATLAFAFVSCGGGSGNSGGGGETISVAGVSLNKNTMTLTAGGSETLSAMITPSNATNKGVTWTSSNDAIALVSGGRVTGVAQGAATITVRTNDGGHTASCAVTVVGPIGTPDTSWYNSATIFTLTTADQLAGLATLVNNGIDFSGKTIILGSNIDLSAYASGEGWTPIGYFDNFNDRPFSGAFNGNGKTISNLAINRTSGSIGLFGYVANGIVQNLGIVNASISGGGTSSVGGIAGGVDYNSSIMNCYSTGAVSGSGTSSVGGIAGSVYDSSITNCYSTGAVSGSSGSVGGIAGMISYSSSITNCYSTGAISGGSIVGGIAGGISYSSITNCYSTGTVSGTSNVNFQEVGGIAGDVGHNSSITGCAALNVSVTTSSGNIGRIAGSVLSNSTLSNNIAWSGMLVNGITISWGTANDIHGANKTAAEIRNGSAFNGMFTDSVWTKQNSYLPGLFGQVVAIPAHIVDTPPTSGTPDASWYNSTATNFTLNNADELAGLAWLVNNGIDSFSGKTIILGNNIDLSAYAGGEGWTPIGNSRQFSGIFNGDGKTISNLAINRTSGSIGLFGYVANGIVQNLGIVNASISGGGTSSVGGIAGGVDYNSSIMNCYSTGAVSGSGTSSVGGIAGYVSNNSSITNCYSTGAVSGSSGSVGGIAGFVWGDSSITGCAALNVSVTRSSSDSDYPGRVAGYSSDSNTLSNNIAWIGMLVNGSTVFGAASDKNGANKTAAEIRNGNAFNGMFTDSVWTKQAGYLPGLFGQVVAIPAHIVDTPPTSGTPDASWYNSTATTFTLNNADQLAGLAVLVNDGTDSFSGKAIILGNNIDLSAYANGEGWIPIGNYYYPRPFSGTFNGDGKTISNLTINRADNYNTLFGYVSYGKIQNLGMVNAVGGIAGSVNSYSSITNCYSTGAVSGTTGAVGGIAGSVYDSSITNCYSTSAISGGGIVGGIAGYVNYNSSITNCYSTGAVSGSGSVGGIAGYVENNSSITGCAALNVSLSLTGSNNYIGRVAGYVGNVTLSNNIAWSGMLVNGITISGTANEKNGANVSAAEIRNGSAFNGMFTDGVWTKQNGYLPGLFGQVAAIPAHIVDTPPTPGTYDTSWYNSAATTFTLNNADQLAGLAVIVNADIDSFSGKTIILGNDIDLFAYAGGEGWTPIGYFDRPFSGAFNGNGKTISNLTINRTSRFIGLFGAIAGTTVQDLGIVNASIKGTSNVGGIAGNVNSSSITNCYSTGAVNGIDGPVGGIAGDIHSSSITNCYSTGAVSGSGSVGGIAGYFGSDSSITGCAALNVSVTTTTSSGNIGRIAGSVPSDSNSTLSNNIAWSGMLVNGITISGAANDKNGANKTAAEIRNGSAFNGMFTDSVWTKQAGYLPGLFGQVVPIPPHIADAPAIAPPAPDTSWYNFASTTFTLNTAEQMAGLAELVNSGADSFSGKTIILGNNIDMFAYSGGEGWTPIGNYYGYRPFSGTFNGDYKTISNLAINRTSDDYIGLFGYVSYGKIQNLGLLNASISGGNYIGGIAGYVYGADVMNCYSTGAISGTGNFVGGVTGYIHDSSAENCYSTAAISGAHNVGGIAGYVANSNITSCAALNVSVTGSGDSNYIGRIAGFVNDSDSTLSNNIAWSGMLVGGSTVSGTANDKNGADANGTAIHNGSAFNNMFTDSVWTKQPGYLPGLFGHVVPIPAHIN